jgi:hypothetical protein
VPNTPSSIKPHGFTAADSTSRNSHCSVCGRTRRHSVHFANFSAISQNETNTPLEDDQDCEHCGVVHPLGKCPENDRRAAHALQALIYFAHHGGEWVQGGLTPDLIEQNMSDLVCDFAHLCDLHDVNMSEVLRRAKGHYDAETFNRGVQEFFPC